MVIVLSYLTLGLNPMGADLVDALNNRMQVGLKTVCAAAAPMSFQLIYQ